MVSVGPAYVLGAGIHIVNGRLRKVRIGSHLQIQIYKGQVRKLIEARESLIANGFAHIESLVTQPKLVRKCRTEGVVFGYRQRIRPLWYGRVKGRKIGSSVDRINPIVDKPSS